MQYAQANLAVREEMKFQNRLAAGKLLAKRLSEYKNRKDAVVLAIPRGGVEVGYEIAKLLKLNLEAAMSKKIGYPGNEEYAIGAVTLFGQVVDENFRDKRYIEREVKRIRKALKERHKEYTGKTGMSPLKGKIVIVTDDGVATGKTMMALISVIKMKKPRKIVIAVPVGPADTIEELKGCADEVVCLSTPDKFYGIGQFYSDFSQVDEEEVKRLLHAK